MYSLMYIQINHVGKGSHQKSEGVKGLQNWKKSPESRDNLQKGSKIIIIRLLKIKESFGH